MRGDLETELGAEDRLADACAQPTLPRYGTVASHDEVSANIGGSSASVGAGEAVC
jgi:hypothetical protein